jgi:MFS family permease
VALAAANLAMVAIMAVAPVRMQEMGRSLGFVGLMVSAHVGAMFAPSPFVGRLADRVGGRPVCVAGLLLLASAAATGTLVGLSGLPTMVLLLVGVGVGWNAAVIGGSSLVVASLPAGLRPRGEGVGEVAMGLAAAAGAPGAGLVVALGGFRTLALVAALAALAGTAAIARGGRPFASLAGGRAA